MTDVLGAPLPLPSPSPEMEAFLARRRSAPAQALGGPGPNTDELDRILNLGLRTPDHGKLSPWRLIVLSPRTRAELATKFRVLAERQPGPDKARAVLAKLTAAPVSILVVSSPVESLKVPQWEQALSAGAVCMNLEHAAAALGFSAAWITDWYSYDADATALLGVREGEQIAGFVHIGSLAEPPLERPRPALADKVERRP